MPLPSVAFRRISEKQKDDILDDGFDPPAEDVLPHVFQQEIRQICDRIQERLSVFWGDSSFDIGSYFIHASSEDDRMLCVEISEMNIVDRKLLEIAHRAVTELAEGYCVDFCNAWGFLDIVPGELHPEFNVFVSKNEIAIYSECESLLQTLGVAELL